MSTAIGHFGTIYGGNDEAVAKGVAVGPTTAVSAYDVNAGQAAIKGVFHLVAVQLLIPN